VIGFLNGVNAPYSVMEMDGGFESWKENGLKIAK